MSSRSQTSSAVWPSRSRSATTTRWRCGSSVRAAGDHLLHLAGQRDLLRPLSGNSAPASRVRVARALEPRGVDGRTVVLGRQARERHGAPLADAAALRLVEQDPVDPRPQRRLAAEPVEALEDGQPGLLDDLLGDARRRHVLPGEPQHPARPAVDERGERLLVPARSAGDEGAVRGPLVRLGRARHGPTVATQDRGGQRYSGLA